MSKKRKGKKSYFTYDVETKKTGKKNKGKDIQAKESKPKHKKIKLSITDKDININRKIIHAPVEVPKDFIKIRQRCNHILKDKDEYMTVEKYKTTTPAYGAYTPMLDTIVATFGEENVHVCPYCFEVMVDPNIIGIDTCENAVAVLYAMATTLVNNKTRKKKDEIEEINKIKERLGIWRNLVGKYEKVLMKNVMREEEESASIDRGVSADEMAASLNSVNQARTY